MKFFTVVLFVCVSSALAFPKPEAPEEAPRAPIAIDEPEPQAEPASLQVQAPAPKGPGGKRRVASFGRPGQTAPVEPQSAASDEVPQAKSAPIAEPEPQAEPASLQQAAPAKKGPDGKRKISFRNKTATADPVPVASKPEEVKAAAKAADEPEAEPEPASLQPQAPAPKGPGGRRKISSFLKPTLA